jgi:hypothetical protein
MQHALLVLATAAGLAAWVCAAASNPAPPQTATPPRSKPNLVFIIADNGEMMGAQGRHDQ